MKITIFDIPVDGQSLHASFYSFEPSSSNDWTVWFVFSIYDPYILDSSFVLFIWEFVFCLNTGLLCLFLLMDGMDMEEGVKGSAQESWIDQEEMIIRLDERSRGRSNRGEGRGKVNKNGGSIQICVCCSGNPNESK